MTIRPRVHCVRSACLKSYGYVLLISIEVDSNNIPDDPQYVSANKYLAMMQPLTKR